MHSSRMLQLEQAILMKCLSNFALEAMKAGKGCDDTVRGGRSMTKDMAPGGMVFSCCG